MDISRKRFVEALFSSGALLLISGCGGGDDNDSDNDSQNGGGLLQGCGSTIAANHGHVFTIPLGDLDSPTARTYDIAGAAGHSHTITLSPAQLQQLKAGVAVAVTSSPLAADGHTHGVNISCVI
jgi:hypothetical protein